MSHTPRNPYPLSWHACFSFAVLRGWSHIDFQPFSSLCMWCKGSFFPLRIWIQHVGNHVWTAPINHVWLSPIWLVEPTSCAASKCKELTTFVSFDIWLSILCFIFFLTTKRMPVIFAEKCTKPVLWLWSYAYYMCICKKLGFLHKIYSGTYRNFACLNLNEESRNVLLLFRFLHQQLNNLENCRGTD